MYCETVLVQRTDVNIVTLNKLTQVLPSGPVISLWPAALLIPSVVEDSLSFVAVRLGRPFLPEYKSKNWSQNYSLIANYLSIFLFNKSFFTKKTTVVKPPQSHAHTN